MGEQHVLKRSVFNSATSNSLLGSHAGPRVCSAVDGSGDVNQGYLPGFIQTYASSLAGINLRTLWGKSKVWKGDGIWHCFHHRDPPFLHMATTSLILILLKSTPTIDLTAMVEVLWLAVDHMQLLVLCAGDSGLQNHGVAAVSGSGLGCVVVDCKMH